MTAPTTEILLAFGIQGSPKHVAGGRGLCYLVGNTIFKPSDDDVEVQWMSELATNLLLRSPSSYRLAEPRSTVDQPGRFVFNGWTASSFVSGTAGPIGRFEDIFRVSNAFHADLAAVVPEKPASIGTLPSRYIEADSVTWEDKNLDEVDNVNRDMLAQFQHLLDRLSEVKKPLPGGLQFQLIHSDLTGNVLFEEDSGKSPAIIDLSPFWRPALYADAIVVADGLAWCGQDRELVELYGTDELRLQLLVRALYWRCLTFAINSDLEWIQSHLPKANYGGAVDIVCNLFGR